MDNNQNNMVQNDYYNNDSYYSNNNYNDNYNNTSYTQEKKSNGLWWKILLLIILIVIIILLLLKFCGSGSGKSADEKYAEFSKRICDAAKTHIGNNPSLMGTAEPGKSVVIKLRTLADANLISAQLENPYYDGNLFKKGTQDKYYPLNNSVRVMVASDGSYYCELVDNSKDVTPPELRLNGDAEITMTVGTDFEDPGYSATDDFDGDITDKVVRSGSVDNSKAGTYTLTYTVQDSAGNTTSKTRTIIFTDYSSSSITLGSILDGVTPMIKLRGANPYCMVKGTQYVEPGAMATDNVDGNITDRIAVTNKVTGNIMGTFRLVYTVEDSSGNKAIAYRAVIVTTECPEQVQPSGGDSIVGVNNAPVITLVGKNSVTIAKGSEYIDLGATAYDKEDGDITSQITTDDTQVNVNAAGIYKVIYRVTDSGGKTATKSRVVTVKDNSIVGNPQVRFTENKQNITVAVGTGGDSLLTPPKAVNENGIQVAVTQKIEDYTTKKAVNAIDWSKVGKYRVIYTAIHGNGILRQTKTITVTIVNGKVTIGGKDTIEVALRKENCDITEADLLAGGVTFSSSNSEATPVVILEGHKDKACKIGTYKIKVYATTGEGEDASKDVTVKVIDRGEQVTPQNAPSKVVITDNSANPTNVYNTNGKWAGGAVTGITLVFKATPPAGSALSRFEYSKSCETIDGSISKLSTGTGTLTWTEEGKFDVCIRAVSTDGIAGPWSDPVKVYLDKTGPKAKFTHTWKDGVSDWHNTSTLTLTYKATDSGSGLDHFEYTYDDVKAKKADNITTYNEANGSLTVKENTEPNRTQLYVYVRAVDKAGNRGEWTLKPAYANMDTVKPEAPSVTVKGNNTALVELTARAKDKTSIRPSGIGKFVYTLNNGDDLSVTARALRSTTCDPLTQVCPNGLTTVSQCENSARPGVAGKDYTQVEDACERASDYKGIITMPTNTTGANVNYDVRVWTVDRAGNRSDGYANQTVTVTPSKKPVTAVEIYNGDDKIADKALCSNKTLYVGNHLTLKAVLTPTDADNANITWTIEGIDVLREYGKCLSSDTAQASDCDQFNATLREAGTGTITVSAGGKTSSCVLTVKKGSVACPAGQYLPKGKDKCEECLAGNYCEGGTYPIDETNDQGITKCPSGKTSPVGSTSSSQCMPTGGNKVDINCPAGQYHNGVKCVLCDANYYCPGGELTKQRCPSYSTSPEGSKTSLDCKCDDGYIRSGGYYCVKESESKDETRACYCGWCNTTTGEWEVTGGDQKTQYNCEMGCPGGTPGWGVKPTTKSCQKRVDSCPAGQQLSNGACYNCPVGYYCEGGTKPAVACPSGKTSNAGAKKDSDCYDNKSCKVANCRICYDNGTSCNVCEEGYRHATGGGCEKVVTKACYCGVCDSKGDWNVTTISSSISEGNCKISGSCTGTRSWGAKPTKPSTCKPTTSGETSCSAGMYLKVVDGVGYCFACSVGQKCAGGTSAPVPCSAGTYQNKTKQSSCIPCEQGTYSSSGASSCTACGPGKYSSAGSSSCSSCKAGTYSSANKSGGCTSCPAGTSSGAGASNCSVCGPGTYSTGGASSCSSCPAGTYQGASRQSSCTPCPVGYYSSARGRSACTYCGAGKTTSGTGSKSSSACYCKNPKTTYTVTGTCTCYGKLNGKTLTKSCSVNSSTGKVSCPCGLYTTQSTSGCQVKKTTGC